MGRGHRYAYRSFNYTYGDSDWGDLLTAYNGIARTYDEIGNVLTDGTWTYTWQNGRELAAMTDGDTTWSYTYDANGMRTSRTNGTTTYNYVYNGSQLTQMTVGNDTLYFTYGLLGPTTVTWNGTTYYYALNIQGDVVGIFNEEGNPVVTYAWDTGWGYNPIPEGVMASTLGELNPLRYRSYVYDSETGYYYLQSRYYDPEIGRFINADAFASTAQGLTGNNMFAYCGNNPVVRKDSTGAFWLSALVGAVVNVVTTFVAAKATGQEYTWLDAGVAAVSGAANAIPVVGPLVSGTITGVYTGVMAANSGANVEESIICGTVAAVCTTASIGNLANLQKPALDIVTNATVDLVFGTGYNSISAATYKAITTNAQTEKFKVSSNQTTVAKVQSGISSTGYRINNVQITRYNMIMVY